MNNDLISREALMPLFMKKAHTMKDRHGVKLGEEWLLNYNDIKDVLDNAPPADIKPFASFTFDKDELDRIVDERVIEPIKNGELVIKEERPKGKWIKEEGTGLIGCSHCHTVWLRGITAFCPNCGADMRKETEDEC